MFKRVSFWRDSEERRGEERGGEGRRRVLGFRVGRP
jgi:hypothetical protein